jgi:hypothetical protein
MTRTTTATTIAAAAITLMATAAPALANGHGGGGGKAPKLIHTHLTLKAAQQKAAKSDKFKDAAVAKLRAKHAGLSGETVDLVQRVKGGSTKWVDTGQTATTTSDGTAAFTFTQTATKQQFRVVFAGDSTYAPSHSGTITVKRAKPAHGSS